MQNLKKKYSKLWPQLSPYLVLRAIPLYLPTVFILILKPLSCWTWIYSAFANSVDPDQLASEEANWSGSALFVIKYVNLYQQPSSSNLISWKLEVGVAS